MFTALTLVAQKLVMLLTKGKTPSSSRKLHGAEELIFHKGNHGSHD